MPIDTTELTLKKIFFFWIPLAATWLMMSIEGPFLSAIIARMSKPVYNLAAYGVAFSFALIVEAPVILMMSASTALVNDKTSYIKLRNFTFTLNIIISLIMLILIIPPVFYFITITLIELPYEVAVLTHKAVMILFPWAGAIGYRRFYHGILIKNNLTKRVAFGTTVRVLSMFLTAITLYFFTDVSGVVVGAGSLSMAVISEAITSRIMAHSTVKKLNSGEILSDEQTQLSYKDIIKFYYPLALTSIITFGVQPMVTFFLVQSRMALESLAVLPVISSFVFIFRSMGLSYQEVGIALIGKKMERYKALRNYALILGITVVFILSIIAFSPVSNIWFHDISGLSLKLTEFSKLPLKIMVIMPGLSVLLSFQTAILVGNKNTGPITFSTITEFSGILIVMFVFIHFFDMAGVIAATSAFIIGRLGANIYLFPPYMKAIRKNNY